MENTDYALGRTPAEYDRLIEQAELLRPLTERAFRSAGITPGMRALDLGCGVGDVSFLVAELVGPSGTVLGVDLDEAALRFAEQRRATRSIENVSFQRGDVGSLALDRTFDVVVGRFVMMYLDEPTAALKAIAENVRPGGITVFHEWAARLSPISPELPVLASFANVIGATFERSGARLDTGLELHSHMRDAGLEPGPRPLAEIAMCAGTDPVAHRRWARFAESLLPKIVEYGIASEREVRDIIDGPLREEFLHARVLVPLSWPMIGQWARKPHPVTRTRVRSSS
jgi:SAM-dependent methyltransferase